MGHRRGGSQGIILLLSDIINIFVIQTLEVMVGEQQIDRRVVNDTADGLSGNTPIIFATIENKIPFMERMLALGCNINKRNKENYIALHFGNTVNTLPITTTLSDILQLLCTLERTLCSGCWLRSPSQTCVEDL